MGVNFKRNFVGDGWRRLESCCYLNRENRKSEIEEIAAEMSTTDEVRFSEGRLNQVKSGLETWREVVIKLDSVLGWECDWYPAVSGGVVTAAFLFVWYWDPTLLTFIAFMGLLATLVDFLGPKIINQVFGSNNWTGAKEQKYEQVCNDLVTGIENIEEAFRFCREARGKKPIVHFVVTCLSLVTLAYLGNRINNFFLAYLLTLALMMLPGLQRKGLLQQHFSQLTAKVMEMAKGKDAFVKKVE